jgi:glutamyl-tRNA reductase
VRLVLTGLSHKTAPVALRERVAFGGAQLREGLLALSAAAEVSECSVLSTCNRTEIYAITRESAWQERMIGFLAEHAQISPGHLQEHVYCFEGTPAVRHLFRVAAGLDSMVVGEAQILSQVKEALREGQVAGTTGPVAQALFDHALRTGKRARTETEINRGAVSISLAAVQLAKQIFGRLADRTVLLLGAGENSEQTARLLLNEGVAGGIVVCNRTAERADELAGRIGGATVPFDRFPEALARADIVVCSTGAPHPIIRRQHAQAAMRARRGRAIFIIDIAVPRDVEPDAGEIDDIFLYNIDDLQSVVERNLQVRESEVEKVEGIVEEEVARFQTWVRARDIAPTIAELKRRAEAVVEEELTRASGAMGELTETQRRAVEVAARRMTRRLLRDPIMHLRQAANSGNGYHEVNAVRTIFGLDDAESEEGAP